jgi:hypothetical protein
MRQGYVGRVGVAYLIARKPRPVTRLAVTSGRLLGVDDLLSASPTRYANERAHTCSSSCAAQQRSYWAMIGRSFRCALPPLVNPHVLIA